MTVVHLRAEGGLLTVTPGETPLVTDAMADLDVLVLEVVGGHLSWSLLSGQRVPAAVLDDVDAAQDWLWAVYGEEVALAIADNHPHTRTALPAQPALVTALHRLAYAHWSTRWWPASTIDAIPALDAGLLADEIAELSEYCDLVLAGADALSSLERSGEPLLARMSGEEEISAIRPDASIGSDPGGTSTDIDSRTEASADTRPNGTEPSTTPRSGDIDSRAEASADTRPDDTEPSTPPGSGDSDPVGAADRSDGSGELAGKASEHVGRAEDYALAAGGGRARDGLVLARGEGGWDWRRCPPGLLDASEHAVSWQVSRAAGVSTVRVDVIAAPDCRAPIPAHLRPHAFVHTETAAGERSATPRDEGAPTADLPDTDAPPADRAIPLRLQRDVWTGSAEVAVGTEASLTVRVFVPGVGPAEPSDDESPLRERIRQFARIRLSGDSGDTRLAAETAAAEAEDDF